MAILLPPTRLLDQEALDFAAGTKILAAQDYVSGRLYVVSIKLFNCSTFSTVNLAGAGGTWTKEANSFQSQGVLTFWSVNASGTAQTLTFAEDGIGYHATIDEFPSGFNPSTPIVASGVSTSASPSIPDVAAAGNVRWMSALSGGTNAVSTTGWTTHTTHNFAGFYCNRFYASGASVNNDPAITTSDLKQLVWVEIAEAPSGSTQTEGAGASYGSTTTLVAVGANSETAASTASAGSTLVASNASSEGASAAESSTASTVVQVAASETTAAGASQNASATPGGSGAESTTVGEVWTTSLAAATARAEASTAGEAGTAALARVGDAPEAATPGEASTASLVLQAAISESAAANATQEGTTSGASGTVGSEGSAASQSSSTALVTTASAI